MIAGMAAAVVAVPFAAAVVGMLWGPRLPRGPGAAAVGGSTVAAALAATVAVLAVTAPGGPHVAATLLTPTGNIPIVLGVRVDGLSAVVALMVTVVALAVQVYSVGYMRAEPRYSSYAALVSLFTAAMLLVVLSADLLALYVGWEVMGICSYFLIGHHWEHRPTSAAAVKAFLMTRLGDVGFLFGIFVLGVAAGSFRVGEVLAAVPDMAPATLTAGTLLLTAGVVGKSAQFPLHTWLPDAMAGPAPVSALIHAATMVAAGTYIVARMYPAFLAAPATLSVLGIIAAVSMLGAALAAFAQDDLKRVLAYSTISQLAYMLAALSAGAFAAGVFHLLTHAAFKALLFLCAGAVIHTARTNLMSEMGGLRRGMPVTFATMTVGCVALIGLPPSSGFFSKDAIVAAVTHAAGGATDTPLGRVAALIVLGCALTTVAVTAAYATRAWLLTFFGPAPPTVPIHEAPAVMRWPLVALAVPALAVGFLGLGFPELRPELWTGLLSLLLIGVGAAAAHSGWRREPTGDAAAGLGRAHGVLAGAFHVDGLYARIVTRPVRRLAREVVGIDEGVVGEAVTGVGRGARRLGGMVRVTQNGNPQAYVTGVLAGVLILAMSVAVLA